MRAQQIWIASLVSSKFHRRSLWGQFLTRSSLNPTVKLTSHWSLLHKQYVTKCFFSVFPPSLNGQEWTNYSCRVEESSIQMLYFCAKTEGTVSINFSKKKKSQKSGLHQVFIPFAQRNIRLHFHSLVIYHSLGILAALCTPHSMWRPRTKSTGPSFYHVHFSSVSTYI